MSMKQHELNILKNCMEKAEGISSRLQKWATDLHTFIKNEIAEEEAELAKIKAAESIGSAAALNPLAGGEGQALSGEGAPAPVDPAPAAPEAPVVVAPVVPVEGAEVGDGSAVGGAPVLTAGASETAPSGEAPAAPSEAAPSPSTASE